MKTQNYIFSIILLSIVSVYPQLSLAENLDSLFGKKIDNRSENSSQNSSGTPGGSSGNNDSGYQSRADMIKEKITQQSEKIRKEGEKSQKEVVKNAEKMNKESQKNFSKLSEAYRENNNKASSEFFDEIEKEFEATTKALEKKSDSKKNQDIAKMIEENSKKQVEYLNNFSKFLNMDENAPQQRQARAPKSNNRAPASIPTQTVETQQQERGITDPFRYSMQQRVSPRDQGSSTPALISITDARGRSANHSHFGHNH